MQRGRGSPRIPPSHTAPVTPQRPQRTMNQPMQQPVSQTPSMPNRNRGRGGGGGRARGIPRGRGAMNSSRGRGVSQRQPQQKQPPPHRQQAQRQPQQHDQMEYGNNDVIDQPLGQGHEHNPSKTSHGSGFFGATPLTDAKDSQPLPDNAMDTVQSIQEYLDSILLDEDLMSRLSVSHKNSMNGQQKKLLKDLNDHIANQTMGGYAFTCLTQIFDELQNQQYDQALRHISDFTKSCKSKNIRFALHRRWIMAFQSIIRIAKVHNI